MGIVIENAGLIYIVIENTVLVYTPDSKWAPIRGVGRGVLRGLDEPPFWQASKYWFQYKPRAYMPMVIVNYI